MELKVTQENLNRALNNVARVASGRTTLPILSNVLLKTENNRLKVSATNLDIAISQHIGTKTIKDGSLTIPARLFQDFISNLPKTTILLKQDKHKLIVEADQYSSIINGTITDEYPVIPQIKEGNSFSISAESFKKALSQVIFSASSDDSRPVLTGVYLHIADGELYIAATDSYRLAEKRLSKIKINELSLLIPVTAMQDLLRIISDDDTEVSIIYDDQQVQFNVGDVELVARLIDGQYPDYKKLIPTKFDVVASVSKKELITITKISGLFSRENAGSITITVSESDESLSVMSIASQVGENKAITKGKITGEGSITLNSRYLLDGLQALDGDIVDFCFNGKLEPIIIKNSKKSDYTHVIMPLKS